MSELNERRWSVLSERGSEQSGLSYGEAAALIARLRGERVSGLCVVTDEAASRLPRPNGPAGGTEAAGNGKTADGKKPRRGRRKAAP